MKSQTLLYAIPKGQTERYTEALLHSNITSAAHAEQVKEIASKDGWHSFRVTTWDGSAPHFKDYVK